MALDGRQYKQIQDALLDGYNETTLRQMVRFGMDEDLDRVVGPGSLEDRVFGLIGWADRTGRILELVQAAHNGNQTNELLKALHGEWFAPEMPAGSAAPPADAPLSPQIFLAYSSKDKQPMQQLRRMLVEAGFSVWTDEGLRAGTHRWEREIRSAIERTRCMVVLLTPDAEQSDWVASEILYAQELGQEIVPVLVRGEARESVPLSLFSVQRIDARQDYAGAVSGKLLPALSRYLNLVGTAPSERATEGATRQAVQVSAELHEAESPPGVEKPVARSPQPTIEFDLATIPAGKFTLSEEAGGKTVTLPEFYISRQPVTNAQYTAFVNATGESTAPKGDADRPVVYIEWDATDAFCEWTSNEIGQTVRLPTEAEWEKAMAELGIKDTDTWEWTSTGHEKYHGSYVFKRMGRGSAARVDSLPGDRYVFNGFRVVVVPISASPDS